MEEGSSWGEKNNILNEDSEGTILISCLLFTLDSKREESVDPEGLDVGLGEIFVEFPVVVNNQCKTMLHNQFSEM